MIFFTLSFLFPQCDANDDGILNILDVLVEVECILNDCWETSPVCQDIDGNIYDPDNAQQVKMKTLKIGFTKSNFIS